MFQYQTSSSRSSQKLAWSPIPRALDQLLSPSLELVDERNPGTLSRVLSRVNGPRNHVIPMIRKPFPPRDQQERNGARQTFSKFDHMSHGGDKASNEPPRGELRDGPNDDHRVSVVNFKDQGSFGVLFCVVPSKTLKVFHSHVPRTERRQQQQQ